MQWTDLVVLNKHRTPATCTNITTLHPHGGKKITKTLLQLVYWHRSKQPPCYSAMHTECT